MNHLDEKTLALYALDAPEVRPQRADIERHLQTCPGCSALYHDIAEYYQEFEDLNRRDPAHAAIARYRPERAISRDVLRELGSVTSGKLTLPQWFVVSLIRHPLRWSTGLLAVALAAVLLLYPQQRTVDKNPAYARAKEEFLIAYTTQGKELWRKQIGFGYESDQLRSSGDLFRPEQVLTTFDVDGDGKNEVLGVFGWLDSPLANVIVCYGSNGSEKWTYEFHRQMRFGQETYPDDYRFIVMMVGDFDRDGKNEVIAVARHRPSWPTAIVRIDAKNGAHESEYWHPGWIRAAEHRDLDGDGIEELFFAGENNSMNIASLAVFDARRVEGYGPHHGSSFSLEGASAGSEKYYLLLPRTDLQTVTTHPRNYVSQFEFKKDGSIELSATETIEGLQLVTFFYFDSSLRCSRVIPSDLLVQFHRRLEQEGKLTRSIDENSIERMRQGVQYWDGEKFTTEPVMNRRYLEAVGGAELSTGIGEKENIANR